MDYSIIKKLKEKLYFTVSDLQGLRGISAAYAKVLCSRYTKKGIFVRLKNNFYVLDQKWDSFSYGDFLKIANLLQVPSYISFMTALSIYEVTTQVQRNFFESVSLKRSKKINVKDAAFNYYKFKKDYYFDFVKKGDFFIATKEKALADSIYLYSFGRYKLDFASLDLKKIDKERMKKIIKALPKRAKVIIEDLCKI